jgi:hypothetical protein
VEEEDPRAQERRAQAEAAERQRQRFRESVAMRNSPADLEGARERYLARKASQQLK